MNDLAPLLAAIDADFIRIAVIVVIFVVAAIGQLLAKIKQIQQPPAGKPKAPRPAADNVADEIEDFMRRRMGRERRAQAPRSARPPQQPAPAAVPVRAEVVGETNRPVGGQVGAHVEKYLDAQDFSRRSEELGAEVVQTVDKEIGQHLHQVFDHSVSQLEATPGEAAKAPSVYEPPDLVGSAADIPDSFATGLLTLITSPDSLRQAIILNEILHRPEERWE